MAEAIVGRAAELAHVEDLLAEDSRELHALVLEGEAGIGKTSVWRDGVERARQRSFLTLSARPAQTESTLPFAALGDLLRPVLDERLPELDEPLCSALEIALQRRAADEPAEQLAVSRATVEVLNLDECPLLIAVDDVQWLDAPSERTLRFALRRIEAPGVRILLARRSDHDLAAPLDLDRVLPYERLCSLRLGPLTLGELDEMLRRRLGLRLPRPRLAELRRASGGNPFYALEIARSAPADGRFPVPPSLSALVEERLRALPAPARDATLLAAAAAQPTVRLVERAAGSSEGLAAAIERDVLAVERARLRFSHPLLASVAYDSASPWELREAHRRLAAASDDEVERATHLAASIDDPSEDVAAELESSAALASVRGAPETAARLAQAAARLTSPGGVRTTRLLKAADFYIAAGDPDRGRAILEALAAQAGPGPDRAAVLFRLADTIGETLDEPIRLCVQALDEAGDDTALQAEIHNALATFTWLAGDLARSTEHVRQVARLARVTGDETLEAIAIGEMCHAQAVLGEQWDRAAMDHALRIEGRVAGLGTSQRPSFQLAVVSVYTDDHETARPLLHRALDSVTELGDEPARATVLFRLTELELRAGNWGTALRSAREAAGLTRQAGIEQEQYVTTMSLAAVLAHLGELEEAADLGAAAFALADAAGDRIVADRCAGVLGFVELSSGKTEAAVEWLLPAQRALEQRGTGELSISGVPQNVIEALVLAGRLNEADEAIAFVDLKGKQTSRAWNQAIAARGRALVAAARGDLAGARDALEAALAAHERLPQPFELARTLLVQGRIERRLRHRAAARVALTRALELFDDLGAARWSEMAAAELARIPGRTKASSELTETERRVAGLVADGLSNKEVAAKLFVTVRTVEANLTKVYAKLGIRSRTELASRLRS